MDVRFHPDVFRIEVPVHLGEKDIAIYCLK
jgi:hypothetical protein